MKLLLTSVFGPYAADDEYGEKSNKMELFHNQVTREQGIFSYRFNHGSQGLYFLAENVDMPATVLDSPTLKRFKKELEKGYDYIGISFIAPNFKKEYIRCILFGDVRTPKTSSRLFNKVSRHVELPAILHEVTVPEPDIAELHS